MTNDDLIEIAKNLNDDLETEGACGEFKVNNGKVYWYHEDDSDTADDDMWTDYCEVSAIVQSLGYDLENAWQDNDSCGFDLIIKDDNMEESKHEYDPTQKYKLDPTNMKIYTKDQYVKDCLGGLPNVDMLEAQWEKLPDAFVRPLPEDATTDMPNPGKVNPSEPAMKLAKEMFSAAMYQGDGDSLDARSAAFLIDELIPPYDSELDTLKHIKRVSTLLSEAGMELIRRGIVHDNSKLSGVEKEGFDKWTPLLSSAKYGSDEYNNFLSELKVSLEHHYKHNSHHPEHYEAGIDGFDLFDLVEMFFDWKAATERTKEGNIYKSIEYNQNRFGIDPQIVNIFINTAVTMGYKKPEEDGQ